MGRFSSVFRAVAVTPLIPPPALSNARTAVTKYFDLMAAQSSGPLMVLRLARLETGEVGALGLVPLGDQRERVVVLLLVRLGVGERRSHLDQELPTVGTDTGHLTTDADLIVVGTECVGERDRDLPLRRTEAKRGGAGHRQRVGGWREVQVAQGNRVGAQHDRHGRGTGTEVAGSARRPVASPGAMERYFASVASTSRPPTVLIPYV